MNAKPEAKGPVAERLLDLLYPPKCGLCGFLGERPICTVCEGEFERYDLELQERGRMEALNGIARLFHYRGRAAQAVQRLKYSRCTTLATPMAKQLADYAAGLSLLDFDLFIPVPIHASRRRLRGFNQSELLCEFLPKERMRPELIERIRATAPQVGLTDAQRMVNLKGAFRARSKVAGARVVLVDDVLTSGHTALECAKALKEAGAKEVAALAFAGG